MITVRGAMPFPVNESKNLLSYEGTVGESIGEEEEFSMESETSRRILVPHSNQRITYPAANNKQQICNEPIHGNCLNAIKGVVKRPCTHYNHCKHDIQ
ncbi:hypothetical protein Tsubulata_038057 [Turnera subulata]|uniref:Uncharacterized protein n=1 Tax=Turnera subulata TaxID=218843 RepID=A0A9Q0JP82_9ROSI|nr:hypothetical protein Tsubulata_038057 [Turnera subulata]